MSAQAPAAPGRLGEPIDVLQLRSYLIALDAWLDARRAELESLDEVVRTNPNADALTPDVALGLQLWQAIQSRYRRLLQVWDRGRVGTREREQLASLVWGRLDDEAWGGHAASGLSLPEACRMSDALTGQLRSRLQLDPAGTQAVGRLRDLRASMERVRDQVGLEPPDEAGAARAQLAEMEDRLSDISEKAGRGGDIGGLLGPLEADVATFERDLIVGGVLRRQQVAQAPAGQPGPGSGAARAELAGRLRADLIVRGQQLDELVTRVAAKLPNPPKYAVPDVTALGPVPTDAAQLEAYINRLKQVAKAMDVIDQAYAEAVRDSQVQANELIMVRAETEQTGVSDELLSGLLQAAEEMLALRPQPTRASSALIEACRHYANWLAEQPQENR
ncbi:MAG: hypothetical protein ACOX61_00210 [Brooklawnia sp.]|jgi:hypothetical protein